MARGKPLTRFLLALCHSPELMTEFNSDRRQMLLDEWGLADIELFGSGHLTLERVQAAVAAEHEEEGASVEVAWWIWFMKPPPKKPDWVWGVDEESPDKDTDTNGDDGDDDDGEGSGGGVEGRSQTQ